MGSEAESISSESVEDVVKQYEINIDVKKLFGAQIGSNKQMNLSDLRHALMDGPGYNEITEKPYHKDEANAQQKYWVNEITQDAWEESDVMQRKDMNKTLKKESRTQAHHTSQDDEEDDLTKIRRSRKKFEFMESLSKQFQQSKLRTTRLTRAESLR
eukprot:749841-Hanusia_phi.AAC.5